MHKVVLYVTLVINVFTLFAMIGAILLHSGQGGGLSDMFGGASSASLGPTTRPRWRPGAATTSATGTRTTGGASDRAPTPTSTGSGGGT